MRLLRMIRFDPANTCVFRSAVEDEAGEIVELAALAERVRG